MRFSPQTASMPPDRLSLLDLPSEVLRHIADLVSWPLEPQGLSTKRRALSPLVLVHSNLFEAFLPQLWDGLEFRNLFQPEPVPVPSQVALQKYGPLVKSITIRLIVLGLGYNGLVAPEPNLENLRDACQLSASYAMFQVLPFCEHVENLCVMQHLHQMNQPSPVSNRAYAILSTFFSSIIPHLKNLRRLSINSLPETLISETVSKLPLLEYLSCGNVEEAEGQPLLGPELSNLKHLTELNFEGVSDKFLINLISHCPLLEKLAHTRNQELNHMPDGSLGRHISRLKQLTRLKLSFINCPEEFWPKYDWPKTLTRLKLCMSQAICLEDIPAFLERAAPNLTHLYLDCESSLDWNERNRLSVSLPKLTHLVIYAVGESDLVSWFKTSVQLRELTYVKANQPDLQSLAKLLSQSTWPNLQRLELEPDDREACLVDIKLQCTIHNILLCMGEYNWFF